MKKVFCTFLLAMMASLVFAVPAKPGLTKLLNLSDGTTVRATLVGDEFAHYWLGLDGKTYQAVAGTETYQVVDPQVVKQQAQVRRTRANARRMKRLAPQRVGEINSITGKKKGLIILVNFTDVTFKSANDNEFYQRIANEEHFSEGDFQGSMYDYFYAQSDGQFELTFDVIGPITVANKQSYYGGNDSNGDDKHPAEMVIEALLAVDSQVNFADYDWNDDKEVDQVYVVYAGKGEADGGAANTIWPHEWQLSEAKIYGDGDGKQKLDGVTIDTYACGQELDGQTGNIAGIGTMCHEFSHCLGYPDFYDTDYSGGPGMGFWDLMDGGSYNGGGFLPAGFTSYERWVAGWKVPTELTVTQTVSNMKALQETGSDAYIIYNPGNQNEYFLLENRQLTGWDAGLPGKGLLIIHVDYDKTVWENNQPNDDPSHQRMTWIAADNKYQYTMYNGTKNFTREGMVNDLYPYGSINAFNRNTTPAATLFNANTDGSYYLNSSVESITQNADGTISFSFNASAPNPDIPPATSEETIDFTSQGFTNGQVITDISGTSCTITFDKGTNSTKPAYYTTGEAIRLYGSNSMTVTSTKTVVKISLTFGSSDGSNDITTDVASYSAGTWAGSAQSVTFTVGGTSGNRRIQKVTISYSDGDTPAEPTLAYYKNADGKKGEALKTALCGIIYNREEQSYNSLLEAFKTTDLRSDGKLWDMYSNITNYDPDSNGGNSSEGAGFNREHSFPSSWFNDKAPMYTDLHHIYPADAYVNNRRSNYPFGETTGNTYKSANDFSKVGTCTYSGYSGTVFEPNDEYKGDFARTYFYMVTCYEEKLPDWYTNNSASRSTLDGTTYPGLAAWQLALLLKWAKDDPVSEKETARNNAVYSIQKNRNPFIDYPGLEQYIWGTMTEDAFSYDNYVGPTFVDPDPDDPNPEDPTTGGVNYKLVASTDQLVSGARYIIACGSKNSAAGKLNSTYLEQVEIQLAEDIITITDDVAVFVLEGNQNDGWTIKNESTGKYLYATGAKKLAEAESSEEKVWTLSTGTSGVIMTYGDYGTMLYNVSSPRFTTYTSNPTASMIQANLYMMVTPTYELANNGITNSTLISSHAGETCNVTLSGRSLYKDGAWNTLCLPFDVTITDSPLANATVKTLTEASIDGLEVSLTFSAVEDVLEAGTPCLIKWETIGDPIVEPTFTDVTLVDKDESERTISLADDHVKFIGYYDAFGIDSSNDDIYYMTASNTLKYTAVPRTLSACRAYFQFSAADAQTHVRDYSFSLDFEGNVATGLDSMKDNATTADACYDLTGRRIAHPTRGLYILNGKKVIIK